MVQAVKAIMHTEPMEQQVLIQQELTAQMAAESLSAPMWLMRIITKHL